MKIFMLLKKKEEKIYITVLWKNAITFGWGGAVNVKNTSFVTIDNLSGDLSWISAVSPFCKVRRCLLIIEDFLVGTGTIDIGNSILVSDGIHNGISLTGQDTIVILEGSRFNNFKNVVINGYACVMGGAVWLVGRNFFDTCETVIGTTFADITIETVSSSYPTCFLNCTTAMKLAGNSYVIGKTPHFNITGVITTAMQVDDFNTVDFDHLIANKAVFNSSGGTVCYLDTVNQIPYTPATVNMQVMSTLVVTNPPTAAELTAEFGTPVTVGAGFTVCIDNNGVGTHVYTCISDGTNWWTFTGTVAP